jgi:hypothetical protein
MNNNELKKTLRRNCGLSDGPKRENAVIVKVLNRCLYERYC